MATLVGAGTGVVAVFGAVAAAAGVAEPKGVDGEGFGAGAGFAAGVGAVAARARTDESDAALDAALSGTTASRRPTAGIPAPVVSDEAAESLGVRVRNRVRAESAEATNAGFSSS